MLAICRMHLRDAHEAEDAMQQVFLSAYVGLLTGTEARDPAAWLATIARHECLARSKRLARDRRLTAEVDGVAQPPDPADTASRAAAMRHLRSAIGGLPRQQRRALVLREFSGLSYQELARELGVTASAVESLLVRARRGLRAQLRSVVTALAVPPLTALREAAGWIAAAPGPKLAAGAVGVLVVGSVGTVELRQHAGRVLATTPGHPVRSAAPDGGRASPRKLAPGRPLSPVTAPTRQSAAAPRARRMPAPLVRTRGAATRSGESGASPAHPAAPAPVPVQPAPDASASDPGQPAAPPLPTSVDQPAPAPAPPDSFDTAPAGEGSASTEPADAPPGGSSDDAAPESSSPQDSPPAGGSSPSDGSV